jgi:hypothetical protein
MLKTISINFLVFLALLISVEAFFYIKSLDFSTPSPYVREINSKNYIEPNTLMGFQPIANFDVKAKKVFGDEVIYDVEYHFDENHRRIVPQKNSSIDKTITFLGASNTFGEGLPVEHSLPFLVAQQNPDYFIYNYAFRGYGPTNIMALLDSQRLAQEIPQKKGIFLYPYMNHQARRLIGTTHFFRWAKGEHPFYSYSKDKGFKREGSFASGQPWRTWFLKTINDSSFFQWLDREYPNPLENPNLNLLCEAFLYMKKRIKSLSPQYHFYVVIGHKKIKAKERIKACLEARNVEYLDLALEISKLKKESLRLHRLDSHSNFKANKMISQRLTQALREKINQP